MSNSLAETLEYLVGFAISTSVAVFSIIVLSGAAPIANRFLSSSLPVRVEAAARQAVVENTTTSVSVDLTDLSVSCTSGTISVSYKGARQTSPIGADCNFSITDFQGVHHVTFVGDSGLLIARVDR